VARGELNHQPWQPRDPADSVLRGLALVPEERRKEGIFIDEPVSMNLAVTPITAFRAGACLAIVRRGAGRKR
jgi:simple sugar transport system ATP-binding protein